MKPATLDEQDQLQKQLCFPRACSDAQAALREYRIWRSAVGRAADISMSLPPAEQLYRGVRTMFAGIFESDDFALRLRWTAAEQRAGYPYQIVRKSIDLLGQFAEAEVSAMITSGTRSTTTGLPTTKQQAHEASARKYGGGKGWRRQEEAGAKKVLAGSAHVRAGSVKGNSRKYDTISPWATTECKHWKRGFCRSGITCPHRHDGFEIHDGDGLVNRCFVCGEKWSSFK